jgi:hypothetical protein
MRKLVVLLFFVVVAGAIWLLFFEQRKVDPPLIEAKYVIGGLNETIDKLEAEKIPPNERWHEIKDLKETNAIDVICYPSYSRIVDQNIVREIADLIQDSKYVEVTEYPNREPDVKLYFRKTDGFILAGRFYVTEGIIVSPEGPLIKIDSMAVKKLMENTDCNGPSDTASDPPSDE